MRPPHPSPRIRRLAATAAASALVLVPAPAASAGAAEPVKRCGSVAFTPQSDDMAAAIRAVGVKCSFARRFVRDSGGRPGRTYRGFTCTRRLVDREDTLAHTRFRCTSAAKVIRWKRF